MNYVFGVDAGGSTTLCAIADTKGNLLSVGQSGPANYKLVGVNTSKKNIRQAIQIAQARANISSSELTYGFYAISGLDSKEDKSIINRFIKEISPTENYGLDNDAIASLILGTSACHGIVLICGTGSNCIAVNENSQRLQVGGLGREFGDFAGGREIALQAMAAAQRGFDGRGPETSLYEAIINYLAVEDLADFSAILHYSARSYPIANLVPLVFNAAEQGDEVALKILRNNGEEMALSAEVALEKLFDQDEEVKVVLTGGVFRSDTHGFVIDALKTRLKSKFPNVEFSIPLGEPVLGSIIQALRFTAGDASVVHREKLIEQMKTLGNIVEEFSAT